MTPTAQGAAATDGGQIKVAVLGGGIGGLTAALELTRPELGGRYKVTVYEQSWRLGGKGASGRNAEEGQRIEEHGLHMWFGFYRNAFRMMREIFEELADHPDRRSSRFNSVGDVFEPCTELVLWDRAGKRWRNMTVSMPDDQNLPAWDLRGWLPTFWEVVGLAAGLLLDALKEPRDIDGNYVAPPDETIAELESARVLAESQLGLSPTQTPGAIDELIRKLERAARALFLKWLRRLVRREPRLRLYWAGLELTKVFVQGCVKDDLFKKGLNSINDRDLIEWFRGHKASELTLGAKGKFEDCTPILRAVYDVAFLFPKGDVTKPSAAAGTALNDLIRLLFTYRGALYYKMRGGMGDVIFAPIYDVLKKRKVEFSFFTEVKALHLDDDKRRIQSIDVVESATDAHRAPEWDPLVPVGDVPSWPSKPDPEPLAEGTPRTLTFGDAFHKVVLAIPVGALGDICGELMKEKPDGFGAMVANSHTVATQAFQVWTKEQPKLPNHPRTVSAAFAEPLDTFCDMSHLLPLEQWDPNLAGGCAYVCGVLPDPPEDEKETVEAAHARVKDNSDQYLHDHRRKMWPKRSSIVSRYWRANVDPWERYVITPAGSVKHRLRSDKSGFDNLVLAGDWTNNGIDGGCIEAAVLSGIQAAAGITRAPDPRVLADAGDRWLNPTGPRPAYIEYGLKTSSGGPFSCDDVSMRVYVLDGDATAIETFVDQTLNAVAPERVTYEPAFGDKVLLMMGSNVVRSKEAPWKKWGAVNEVLASFWIPVNRSDPGSDREFPDFRLFTSHIVVNNPMSLYAGRELYGYAKAMGQFTPADGLADGDDEGEIKVEVFGGNFGETETATWLTLFTATRQGRKSQNPLTLEPLKLETAGALAKQVISLLKHRTVTQVFLKQFRDAQDHKTACYQAVVEAPNVIRHIDPVLPFETFGEEWEFYFHEVDTHPIVQELGLVNHRTSRLPEGVQAVQATNETYQVAMSFDVLRGVEVAT